MIIWSLLIRSIMNRTSVEVVENLVINFVVHLSQINNRNITWNFFSESILLRLMEKLKTCNCMKSMEYNLCDWGVISSWFTKSVTCKALLMTIKSAVYAFQLMWYYTQYWHLICCGAECSVNTHPAGPAIFGQMLRPLQMNYDLLQPPPQALVPPPPFNLLPPVPHRAAANCAVPVCGVRQSHAAAANSVLGGGRRTKIRHAPYSRCPRQRIILGGIEGSA